MAKLSMPAVAQLAWNAGIHDKTKLVVAVAIAMAESGGDTEAINSVPCVGLWQINCKGQMHGLSVADAKDPVKNAAAMAKISKNGSDWTPWTTYTHKTYQRFMRSASEAVGSVDTNGQTDLAGTQPVTPGSDYTPTALDPMSGIVAGIKQFSDGIRNDFLIGAVVVIALALIIMGFVILNRETISKGAKLATKVASKGLL